MRPLCTTTAAAATALLVLPVTSGYASSTSPATPALRAQTVAAVTPALHRAHTVRPGETLTSIAVDLCGPAIYWTGLYHANRAIIGPDPNVIRPGQVLAVACYDPPVTTARHAYRYHARARDADGDYDGDRAPARRAAARRAAATSPASAVTGASHYSYAGLEALWIAAGGPAWAAAQAARIAICESGGSTYAHNPSGATGLWQILGQVVPGNLYNPYVNALNAVAKFRASGNTFAQWVCK